MDGVRLHDLRPGLERHQQVDEALVAVADPALVDVLVQAVLVLDVDGVWLDLIHDLRHWPPPVAA